MRDQLHILGIGVVFFPLIGAIVAGLMGKKIGKTASHWVAILSVGISFLLSLFIAKVILLDNTPAFNDVIYTWGISGSFAFYIGFLIDHLTAVMMVTVTFVSLLVHIYSIGYMADDPGYQRFFAYMSLFTFMMLLLVVANNFLQIYLGWEGVGLVSYLLIGFWFHRETANFGSLKAFIVNRIGDMGFLLGIAGILSYFGTLDYSTVFSKVPEVATQTISIIPGHSWSLISVISILLFIGAMGKSAQVPLHVWLPESMEGPTPISALIHAATMVTAGVFMVARMSPLFEYSQTALSLILIIGATTALFTGLLAIVEFDLKRVIAYSTLSQLGYMMAGVGASAYAAGIFHLMTHAFFKALLFLAAGSVLIAMHHEQDMRKMGGLRRYLPITYICFLIGALALSAIPPFAGFYSKDLIIECVGLSTIPGATYAYVCLIMGAYVTALYIFRAFFFTFHTSERFDSRLREHLQESSAVVYLPLILLSIPSVIAGFSLIDFIVGPSSALFGSSLFVLPQHNVLAKLASDFHGPLITILQSLREPTLWFAVAGIFTAWLSYIAYPSLTTVLTKRLRILYSILLYKYGFDDFNQIVWVRGVRNIGNFLFKVSDATVIDSWMINGSGRLINWISARFRKFQTGYLYHYSFVMVIGLIVFLWWMIT